MNSHEKPRASSTYGCPDVEIVPNTANMQAATAQVPARPVTNAANSRSSLAS
jgi:hypothetical protein